MLDFIKEQQTGEEELYKELLTFDLYLRENVKSRPAFAGDYTVKKEVKKQYGKTVHLERFSYDVIGTCERKELTVLFDYEKRSKLNHQAAILSV